MLTSETIDQLAAALAVAQGQFKPVQKSGYNKNFGKHYSTLTDVIEAIREPLSKNGLSFVQTPELTENLAVLLLSTRLMHASGQWIEFSVAANVSRSASGGQSVVDLQAWMSTLTSIKRVSLSALLGVSPDEDDDGNAATAAATAKPTRANAAKPAEQNGATHYESVHQPGRVMNDMGEQCNLCNAKPGQYHGTACKVHKEAQKVAAG